MSERGKDDKFQPSFYFETFNYSGQKIGRRFFAKSEAVARYKFRRWVAMEHGIRAHPHMIYKIGDAS